MSEFTYTVFLAVASLAATLIAVFAAGIIGLLLSDARVQAEPPAAQAEPFEVPRAA